LGGDGDFTNDENWTNGLPKPSDDLYFDGSITSVGATFYLGDKTYPLPPTPHSPPGTWTYTFEDEYAGIHLVNNYNGTLTFPFSLTFGNYEQTSGVTFNTVPNLSTTVTSQFLWTRGTINGGAEGYFNLYYGASGIVNPTGVSVSTGSTMTLMGGAIPQIGSTVEFLPGTVNWLLGEGLVVEENSQADMELEVSPSGFIEFKGENATSVVNKHVTIKQGGTVKVYAVSRDPGDLTQAVFANDDYMSFKNQGGTFSVEGFTTVRIDGSENVALPGGGNGSVSYNQTAGKTMLQSGCIIETMHAVVFTEGRLEIPSPVISGEEYQAPHAQIKLLGDGSSGFFYFSGTTVLDMTGTLYNTLRIIGDMTWDNYAVFECDISNLTDKADQIVVTGYLSIKDTLPGQQVEKPDIKLNWINQLTQNPGHKWKVVTFGSKNADEVEAKYTPVAFPDTDPGLEAIHGTNVIEIKKNH
jgi:hypothetical protein